MLSADCLLMCEHMSVPSYVVGGRTFLNLSGKKLVAAVESGSSDYSGSEESAIVWGGQGPGGLVKGSFDPKLHELMALISADSKQMREEIGKVAGQLELQVKATTQQGATIAKVVDQMCEFQNSTSGRIEALQKAQAAAVEDQSRAMERMDAALAKMRAGDQAVVGPPGAPMQP